MATESVLTIPKHELLKRSLYDFRNPNSRDCGERISGRFLFAGDCFGHPILYDQVRREIFQKYLLEFMTRESLAQKVFRHLYPRRTTSVDEKTLVINIRSGHDIFRNMPPPQSDYMQPPLSFYKYIIDTHGYRDCLIVTERDQANPVIPALLTWNSSIRLNQHISVKSDISVLLSARHLVMAHSSFTWCLALMSENLSVLHQPGSFTIRGVDDFEIHTYQINNYIKAGSWAASPSQLKMMVEHSVKDIDTAPPSHSEGRERSAWL